MKLLRYSIVNLIPLVLVITGILLHNELAENIGLAILWVTAILGSLLLFIPDDMDLTEFKHINSVSKEIDLIVDIGILILLIWLGYIYLPIFYSLHMAGLYSLRLNIEQQ